MLEIRPNCERCDKDLPPESTEARICTYECTFCAECVDRVLNNVCPNCGGGFERRPIRPTKAHRPGVGLQHHPAATARVNTRLDDAEIREFSALLANIEPRDR